MKILIVEDEAIIALGLALALEESGHSVVGPVTSSVHALALCREHKPVLALVDINLSSKTEGIGLARALQRLQIPTVFVSAQYDLAWANRDAALGFIGKPYTAENIAESLEAIEAILCGRLLPMRKGVFEAFTPPSAGRS